MNVTTYSLFIHIYIHNYSVHFKRFLQVEIIRGGVFSNIWNIRQNFCVWKKNKLVPTVTHSSVRRNETETMKTKSNSKRAHAPKRRAEISIIIPRGIRAHQLATQSTQLKFEHAIKSVLKWKMLRPSYSIGWVGVQRRDGY